MPEIILSINAGSSSVKVSVYSSPASPTSTPTPSTTPSASSASSGQTPSSSPQPSLLAEAQIEGLTAPPARLKYARTNGDFKVKGREVHGVKTQEDAFNWILEFVTKDEGLPEVRRREDVRFTCHRVVHGGEFECSQVVDETTYHRIEVLSDLAPLHNAPALSIINAVIKALPTAINVAYFDSAFHTSIPPPIHTYMIDPEVAKTNQLRKYGFHGISYHFIVDAVAEYLNKPASDLNIIALHLGSGASACCIQNGRSLDTSMGLTPLAGLPGATRSGSIDPSLIFHFTHDAGMPSRSASQDLHITYAEEILNKQSGWKSLTGTTDFGVISAKGEQGDEACELAFQIFVDRVLNYVGPYFVKLAGKVDALVFAGGIGERGTRLRREVVRKLGCLGFELDERRNESPGGDVVGSIGKEDAKYRTLVVRTDEQLQMAKRVLKERERFEKGVKGNVA